LFGALLTYISQGSAAADLTGGDFNCIFLRRSFLNLTTTKIVKIDPLLSKL